MAIIYETKEDFERDKLKDQEKDMNYKAARQGSLGLASVVLGDVVDDFNTKRTGGMKLASFALLVVGAVEVVKSLFSFSKAHDLKMKRERLGPQTSVIPADANIGDVMGADCPVCKHTANIQPTTLLEQAQRPDMPIYKG